MSDIKVGKPDVDTGRAGAHARHQAGQLAGNYEQQAGHLPDGRVDRRALDRHQRRRRRSRSTRGCRTSRRPRRASAMAARPIAGADRARARLRGARRRAARVRGGADARASRCESTRRRRSRSDRSCSTSRSRSRRGGARYADGEQDRLAELFGEPRALGHDAAHAAVDAHDAASCPAFTRRDAWSSLHVPCTYDFDVAAAKYLAGAGRRRGAARVPVQRHGLLLAAEAGAADRAASPGSRRPSTACRCAVWRETMDALLPRTAHGCACRGTPSTGCPRTGRAARAAELGATPSTRCSRPRSERDGRGSRAGSPTPCCTRATCCGPTAGRR